MEDNEKKPTNPAREGYLRAKRHLLDALGRTQEEQGEQLGVPQALVSQMRNRGGVPRSTIERAALLVLEQLTQEEIAKLWPAAKSRMGLYGKP